jgi:glycosyltransferase involved in cell wall biosynthesis
MTLSTDEAVTPLEGVRRRLRVLVVSDAYPPLIGGANRSTRSIARALSASGHTVTVATAYQPGQPAFEVDGDVEVHRIRDATSRVPWVSADPFVHVPPPFPDPEAVTRFRRLVQTFRPDVVYAYGWLTHSCVTALWGTDIPVVLAARDRGNFCAVRTYIHKGRTCSGPAPLKCLRCSMNFYGAAKGVVAASGVAISRALIRRRLDAIHAVGTFVGENMQEYLANGLDVRTAVIPNFRDPGDAPEWHPSLDELPDEPFILFVGAFREVKGINVLFDAYLRMRQPRPPLVLIGTLAPDTPKEFPPGVTVLLDVPHGAVLSAWDKAMFGVFPSVCAETFGNVVQEAESRGRAVVGTYPGGHEDLIDDGSNGFLVPQGSVSELTHAMQSLADDPELRARMGEASLRKVEELRIERVFPQLEALLYRVVDGHG